MTINQVLAMWVLEIWNPDKVNFLSGTRKRQMRLFYRTNGVVLHDRVLNPEGRIE